MSLVTSRVMDCSCKALSYSLFDSTQNDWCTASWCGHQSVSTRQSYLGPFLYLTLCWIPLSTRPFTIAPLCSWPFQLFSLIQAIDYLMICGGNHDSKFLELWKHCSFTLHDSSGMLHSVCTIRTSTWMFIAYIDLQCMLHIPRWPHCLVDHLSVITTIWHNKCLLFVPDDSKGPHRSGCISYRLTLTVQGGWMQNLVESETTPSSQTNKQAFLVYLDSMSSFWAATKWQHW